MTPLNEPLYEALERVFRHVEIVDQGVPAHVRHTPDWHRGGRQSAEVMGGEYYKVSCPFCGDTRKRLWFNHHWNVRDRKSRSDMLHLVVCYNEHCVDSRQKQLELRDLVFGGRPVTDEAVLLQPKDEKPQEVQREIKLPGPRVPITDRKHALDAIIDLEERNFDLQELHDRWGVYYSLTCSDCSPPLFGGRIVFPVIHVQSSFKSDSCEPVVVGWQARAIEPLHENEPKYLTAKGMRKSHYLYGLSAAIDTTGPLVLCEGATDVWRLGTNAVAIFGKDLSRQQLALFAKYGVGRPVVVFLDADAAEGSKKAAQKIRDEKRRADDNSRVAIVELPVGRNDVGDCSRGEAWRAVAAALNVSFGKLSVDWRDLGPVRQPPEFESRKRKKRKVAAR